MSGLVKQFIFLSSALIVLLGAGCGSANTNINSPANANTNVPVANVPVETPSSTIRTVTSTVYLVAMENTPAWTKAATTAGAKKIGCNDYIVPTKISALGNPTAPLRSTLEALLNMKESDAAAFGLSSTVAKSTLTVGVIDKKADGTFVVNLSGVLNPSGVCDDPRIKSQVEETVRQFGKFQILLNGKESNWRCFGDESGLCK